MVTDGGNNRPELLAEYAFALREGGLLYTVTDVKELYDWEVLHLSQHPLFEKVTEQELVKQSITIKFFPILMPLKYSGI